MLFSTHAAITLLFVTEDTKSGSSMTKMWNVQNFPITVEKRQTANQPVYCRQGTSFWLNIMEKVEWMDLFMDSAFLHG